MTTDERPLRAVFRGGPLAGHLLVFMQSPPPVFQALRPVRVTVIGDLSVPPGPIDAGIVRYLRVPPPIPTRDVFYELEEAVP